MKRIHCHLRAKSTKMAILRRAKSKQTVLNILDRFVITSRTRRQIAIRLQIVAETIIGKYLPGFTVTKSKKAAANKNAIAIRISDWLRKSATAFPIILSKLTTISLPFSAMVTCPR